MVWELHLINHQISSNYLMKIEKWNFLNKMLKLLKLLKLLSEMVNLLQI